MNIPEGFKECLKKEFKNNCAIMRKAAYGLVQAARQYYKKFVRILTKEMGFEKCMADQCLLKREDESGVVLICIYVDDTLCIGDRDALEKFTNQITEYFNIVEGEGILDKYFGCELRKVSEKKIIMKQTNLSRKINRNFEADIKMTRNYQTPAQANEIIIRPTESEEMILKERQSRYCSGVGMLLYLIKYSRPDISNSVRELSKVNDGATEGHWKSLIRVIKYVMSTKDKSLKYRVNL